MNNLINTQNPHLNSLQTSASSQQALKTSPDSGVPVTVKKVNRNEKLEAQERYASDNHSSVRSTKNDGHEQGTKPQQNDQSVDLDQLRDAAEKLTQMSRDNQRQLEFRVDQDTEKTIVRVLDRSTQETIRQIPSEEALDLVKSMRSYEDQRSGILNTQA